MGANVVEVEVEVEVGGDEVEVEVVVVEIWLGQCVNMLLLLAASLSSVFSFVHTLLLCQNNPEELFYTYSLVPKASLLM